MAQVHPAVARGPGGFNKLVVLKSLESQDVAFRRMFLDEARLAALLHHPNVVNTYEVSETDGQYFIAMEYLDGQPLDKLVRETKKLGLLLPPRLCARIIADALSGLHYTHELRDYAGAPLEIVHRDISPHNLFLTYEGNAKLLDFGVAKSAAKTAETDIGVIKGKLAYMAPEQAAALLVDRRADVFAIGAVLWELLTLQRLRQADSAAGVLSEAIHGGLPDLQQARPDVGRRLEAVLWRALANQPARRYQTAQEMRDALVDYLAAERDQHGSRLVLVGFSDARGSVGQNLKLSLERARKIAAELRERGVQAVELDAMGHELPVASNDSEGGREKNRRVEVWLR